MSRIDYATLGAQRALSSCFITIARSSAKNPFAEDLVTEHLLGLSVRGSTLFHSNQEVVSLSMALSMLGAEDPRSSSPTHGLNLQGRRLACVHPHESEQRWQRATAAVWQRTPTATWEALAWRGKLASLASPKKAAGPLTNSGMITSPAAQPDELRPRSEGRLRRRNLAGQLAPSILKSGAGIYLWQLHGGASWRAYSQGQKRRDCLVQAAHLR